MNKTILIAGGAAIASLAVGAATGYFFAKRFVVEKKIEYPPRKVDEFLPPRPEIKTKQGYSDRLEEVFNQNKAAYDRLIKSQSPRKANREEVPPR